MAIVGLIPRLLAIALLPWLIVNCMGGSSGSGDSSPSWPPDSHAPSATEQAVVEHVWQAMDADPYPVWLYRDTWTPDPQGRTWGDIGRASTASCPSKHGSELCAWGVWQQGHIAVLHMTPETVDLFNATYQPPEAVSRDLFTLPRLAGLLIYERMHVQGYAPYLTADQRETATPERLAADEARRQVEQAYRARVDWAWIETL